MVETNFADFPWLAESASSAGLNLFCERSLRYYSQPGGSFREGRGMSEQPTHRVFRIVGLESKMQHRAVQRRPFRGFVGLLAALPALGAFLLLTCFTRGSNALTGLDAAVHTSIGELAQQSPALTAPCRMISALGDGKTLAALALLVAVGLFWIGVKNHRYFRELSIWVIGVVGGGLLNFGIKCVIHRPRPDPELALVPAEGWSFPSGHAMGSIVVFGMAAYLLTLVLSRRSVYLAAATLIATLVLAIGFSRVWLGDHWLSDVVGGYLAGMCWLALCVTAFILIRSSAKDAVRREVPPEPNSACQPAAPAVARRRRPWRRSRNAEGCRLAHEDDSEPPVPHAIS